MRNIASIVLLAGLSFTACWYGTFLATSRLVSPQASIDTQNAGNTIWRTEYPYLVWSRAPLETPRPKVVILGHSAVRMGFAPAHIAPILPGWDAHNMSLAAAEIREIGEAAELAFEYMPPATVPSSIFVIGIHFGEFMAQSYGYNAGFTNLSMSRLNVGIYRRVPGGGAERHTAPAIPKFLIARALTALRPLFLAKEWFNQQRKSIFSRLFPPARAAEAPPLSADPERPDDGGPPESKRKEYLLFWYQYIGRDHLPKERLAHLEATVAAIRARGARVVLVDIPSPQWMVDRSPLYKDYLQVMPPLIARLTVDPGVSELSPILGDGLKDQAAAWA